MGWRDGLVWLEVRLSGRTERARGIDAPANPSPHLSVPCHSLNVLLPQTRISRFLRVRRLGIWPSPRGNGFM